MKRIAIVGGGIAGVSAAYEISRHQRAGAPVDFTLFEVSPRLGGIVETEKRDGFLIECGPDSWVTEKPWALELAVELGLEAEIIASQDQHRKTYMAEDDQLLPLPEGMRMMVPTDLSRVDASPLFSPQAKLAYRSEPERAQELKAAALDAAGPGRDESVRDFVIRHFGAEVADTVAAPLLAGVLGGDIAELSVRAALPAYVALEREHGSLILGLQQRDRASASAAPIFTTLRHGLAGLIAGMQSQLTTEAVRCGTAILAVEREPDGWYVRTGAAEMPVRFDAILLAAPAKATAQLLARLNPAIPELLPRHSSSAIVVALAFPAALARSMHIPRGFGFLVPQRDGMQAARSAAEPETLRAQAEQALLACTFVDQKFSDRTPAGAVLLRAFFGGPAAAALLAEDDATLASLARGALKKHLGPLPEPAWCVVRRWPDSLPLYTVGHLDRIAELEKIAARLPHLRLVGNAYRGVGLPDLIRDGRNAAREMIAALAGQTG